MVRRAARPHEHRDRERRSTRRSRGRSTRSTPICGSPAPAARVHGRLTLDTSVPGWHGTGAVDVERLNLARWLNRDERPSDITGHVTFNLALELGRRFPRGMYTFDGPHAMYMDYAADDVRARGQITVDGGADRRSRRHRLRREGHDEGRIDRHRRAVSLSLSGHDRRASTCGGVPATIPVPRVESLLTFDYDVDGRFSEPFITGRAAFARVGVSRRDGRRRHGRLDRHAAAAAALHRRRRRRRASTCGGSARDSTSRGCAIRATPAPCRDTFTSTAPARAPRRWRSPAAAG